MLQYSSNSHQILKIFLWSWEFTFCVHVSQDQKTEQKQCILVLFLISLISCFKLPSPRQHDMRYLSDWEHPWQGLQRCVSPSPHGTVFPRRWRMVTNWKVLPVAHNPRPSSRIGVSQHRCGRKWVGSSEGGEHSRPHHTLFSTAAQNKNKFPSLHLKSQDQGAPLGNIIDSLVKRS